MSAPETWAMRETNDLDIAFSIDCGKLPVADVYRDGIDAARVARLIAAAPELYEALVEAAVTLGGVRAQSGDGWADSAEHVRALCLDALKVIQPALAKARGEQ